MYTIKQRILLTMVLLGMLVTVILVYSCEKERMIPASSHEENISTDDRAVEIMKQFEVCGELELQDLLLDDKTVAGHAFIYNSPEFLYVELIAGKNNLFTDTYMHIASTLNDIPLGHYLNPNIEVFEYKIKGADPSKFRSYKIPLDQSFSNKMLITIACKVLGDPDRPGEEQLAWINGLEYGEDIKGRVFRYTKQFCPVRDKEVRQVK